MKLRSLPRPTVYPLSGVLRVLLFVPLDGPHLVRSFLPPDSIRSSTLLPPSGILHPSRILCLGVPERVLPRVWVQPLFNSGYSINLLLIPDLILDNGPTFYPKSSFSLVTSWLVVHPNPNEDGPLLVLVSTFIGNVAHWTGGRRTQNPGTMRPVGPVPHRTPHGCSSVLRSLVVPFPPFLPLDFPFLQS